MKNVELPKIPRKLNATERKLASMFMERVPTNLLDSGLVYGYNFDYNREHPIWEQPESHVEFGVFSDGDLSIDLKLNTYKLLSKQLEYDKKADQKFQKWRKQWDDKEDDSWEAHLEELPALSRYDNTPKSWTSGYTYNADTLLDQQIVYYFCTRANYVIIQVHGGCDARCGFTEPILFREEFLGEFNPFVQAAVYCSECRSWWDYDNTGHCMCNSEGTIGGLADYPCEKGTEGKVGTVVVREDYKAFCPICGKGLLE